MHANRIEVVEGYECLSTEHGWPKKQHNQINVDIEFESQKSMVKTYGKKKSKLQSNGVKV